MSPPCLPAKGNNQAEQYAAMLEVTENKFRPLVHLRYGTLTCPRTSLHIGPEGSQSGSKNFM